MTDFLAKKHIHERDAYIEFEEASHVYTISLLEEGCEDSEDPGPPYTSVTTWIHTLFQNFNPDSVIRNMRRSKKWANSPYFGMTDQEIKDMWEKKRDTAAEAGTKMHYDIECFYNGMEVSNTSIEFKYFMEFEKDRFNTGLLPYRTEWTVFDEDYLIAGSIDMTFMDPKTGKLKIYDWKRCKEIKKGGAWRNACVECIDYIPDTNFWHYTLQLNMYRCILESKYDKEVDELWLVCLHPENKNGTYIKLRVPLLDDDIAQLFEYRINQLKR
jgi:ATP-dependent exoDNAse (exonuclease V) beta subunit